MTIKFTKIAEAISLRRNDRNALVKVPAVYGNSNRSTTSLGESNNRTCGIADRLLGSARVTRSTVFLSPDKLQGPLFQVQTHVRVSLPLLKQFRVAQIQLLFAQIGDSMARYPLHYKVLDAMQPPASL